MRTIELTEKEHEKLVQAVREQAAEWGRIVATAKPPSEKMWNCMTAWQDLLHKVKAAKPV